MMLRAASSRAPALLRGAHARHASSVTADGALGTVAKRADESFARLMDAEWLDEPTAVLEADVVAGIVEEYRPLYDAGAVASDTAHKDAYEAVRKAHVAAETARLVELYADHMTMMFRDHMDMTGGLGDNTALPEKNAQKISETLREYVDFLNAIEVSRVRRKVDAQLGRKVVQLRQVISVDQFSTSFAPIAGDHMVVPRKRIQVTPDGPPSPK